MNLLLSEQFWFGFYDKVYLCGPTIENDKLYKNIKVKDDQKVTKQEEFLPKLEEWIETQTQEVKRDPTNAPKCLFVFEDITSYHTLQNKPGCKHYKRRA